MIAALLIAVSLVAQGDPASKELAAKSFAEGEAAFAKRKYSTAALAFERAARLVPHPSTWLNAAEAWERGGDFVHAAEDCDRVLEIVDAPARFVGEAKRRLARLEPKIARVEVLGGPERRVRIDGGEARRPPFSKRLAPGKHRFDIDGRIESVTLAAGESRTIELEAPAIDEVDPIASATTTAATPTVAAALRDVEPDPPPPPPIEEPPPATTTKPDALRGPPVSSWLAFGAATAAFGAGLTFGGLTLSAESDYEKAPTLERAELFFDRRRATNLLLGTAAVGAALGVILWVFDEPEP